MKGKVVVGFSGGVDSAVAALLLLEQGYEVVGAFMKCWSGDSGKSPCWIDDRRDALHTGAQLGIEVLTLDKEDEYREHVVEYMYEEYSRGRTPNPDILCNALVKFKFLVEEAQKRNFDNVATGHYARIQRDPIKLFRGLDVKKDQSYFLHSLSKEQLQYCMFPVGNMTKTQVREKAESAGLDIAHKPSTKGICFVGNVALKTFLRERLPPKIGNIVDTEGNILGEHDGMQYVTIGQRKGLGIGGGTPYYVAHKNPDTNEITVVKNKNHTTLQTSKIFLTNTSWISTPADAVYDVQYRYQQKPIRGQYNPTEQSITFETPAIAVPPGQFAVLYDGNECLGGGTIKNVTPLA